MAPSDQLPWRDSVPISLLQPSEALERRSVTGIVTLIWPYSVSQRSSSLLLVEPDFRLRRQKGQVRVHFTGSSAKALARSELGSGDRILLSLEGVVWAEDESARKTPGRGIEWELQFAERLLLQLQRDGQDPVLLDIDHPPDSPHSQASSPTPPESHHSPGFIVPARIGHVVDGEKQAWVSPAFLKRKELSSTPILNSIYDPFEDGDDYRETSPSKRTKFGRKRGEWRFADRSPSPVMDFEAAIDDHYGVPQEVMDGETAVKEPAVIQAKTQPDKASWPSAKALDAANPSTDILFEGRETSKSPEGLPRDPNGNDGKPRGATAGDSSSQTLSPHETDTDNQRTEERVCAQDTCERETWSTSSPAADPSMEVAAGILCGDNRHLVNNFSMEQNSMSTPARALSSPEQSSRPTSSKSNRTKASEHTSTMQDNHLDSESIESVPFREEPFSKLAYVASESSRSSDMSSEDLELVEAISDSSTKGLRHHRSVHDTPQGMISPIDFMPSSPQTYGHGYDGTILSRPKSRAPSLSVVENRNGGSSTNAELQETNSYAPEISRDTDEEMISRAREDEGEVPETGHDHAFDASAMAGVGLRPHYEGQLSSDQTNENLSFEGRAEGQLEISEKADNNQDTRSIQEKQSNREPMDDPFEQDEQRSALIVGRTRKMKDFGDARHEDLQGDKGALDEEYEKAPEYDEHDVGQQPDAAQSKESENLDNDNDMEEVREQDDNDDEGAHRLRNVKSASSGSHSRSKPVEIIDVDEYESVVLPGEEEDFEDFEEGDYWSDEEHQTGDELEFECADGAEVSGEEELGSDEEEFEEEDMDYEDSALIPSVTEQAGQGESFASGMKTPNVEIIDLESDEGIEPSISSADRFNAPQVSKNVPDIESTSIKEATPASGLEEYVPTAQAPQQWEGQQPKDGTGLDTPGQTQKPVESASGPRGEVRDTYSEDAASSDTEASEALLAMQGNNKPESIQWLTHHSANSIAAAQALTSSIELSVEIEEQHTTEHGSQALPSAEDDAETPSHFSPQQEKTDIRESDGMVDSVRSPTQKLSSSPPQEAPTSRSSSSAEKPNNQVSNNDDEAHDTRTALENTNIQQDRDVPKQHDGESSEQETREYSLIDLREELIQRSDLITPNDTQTTKVVHEPSDLSKVSQDEQYTLPTPSLTQRTSELLPLATPMPRKPSLVEKLKEMRSNSARKRQSSLSNELPAALSPWFGTSRSSQIAPSSDQEHIVAVEEEAGRDGDVSSEAAQSELDREPSLPSRCAVSPPLNSVFTRLPSSSPPPRPEPDSGFRTSLSYFAPLSTLRSHYNSTTSVLALVVATTSITRAAAGPKDYHMTLFVTDPSSSSPPSVTSARIFRPLRFPFPEAKQGDAVLLRNFRVVSYRKQLGLLSTDSSAWAVFRRGDEPQIRGPPVDFGAEERGFARGHWDWWGTVEQGIYLDSIPQDKVESPRRSREVKSGKGKSRSSIVRHELRDGTTYVDRPRVENTEMHELRDGTQWSDSKS